jgi:hypothetical protein
VNAQWSAPKRSGAIGSQGKFLGRPELACRPWGHGSRARGVSVNARGVAVKARIFVSTAHEHTIQKVDDNTPATDHPSDADKVVEDTRQAMHAAAT